MMSTVHLVLIQSLILGALQCRAQDTPVGNPKSHANGKTHPISDIPSDADIDREVNTFEQKHCDWPKLATFKAYQRMTEFELERSKPETIRVYESQRKNLYRALKKLNEASIPTGKNIRSIEIGRENRPLDGTGLLVLSADSDDSELERILEESLKRPAAKSETLVAEKDITFSDAEKKIDPRAAAVTVKLCRLQKKLGVSISTKPYDDGDLTLQEISTLVQTLEALDASGKRFKRSIKQIGLMSGETFVAAKLYSGDPKILLVGRNVTTDNLLPFTEPSSK